MSLKVKEEQERDFKYRDVMRCLIRRYVTTQQRKVEDTGVTEDDVSEMKQLITGFKSELFDVLRKNGMQGISASSEILSRKERIRERRLLKDFNIDLVETIVGAFKTDAIDKAKPPNIIRKLASGKREKAKKNWNAIVGAARAKQTQIGRTNSVHRGSLKILRESVLQEEEVQMKGVKRFAEAGRRIIRNLDDYREELRANNIAAIEEEVPGSFSATPTPRSSIPCESYVEPNISSLAGDSNLLTPRSGANKKECSIINVEVEKEITHSKSIEVESSSPENEDDFEKEAETKSYLASPVTNLEEDEKNKLSPLRRHSAPPTNDGQNLSRYLQNKNAKVFPKFDDTVNWM